MPNASPKSLERAIISPAGSGNAVGSTSTSTVCPTLGCSTRDCQPRVNSLFACYVTAHPGGGEPRRHERGVRHPTSWRERQFLAARWIAPERRRHHPARSERVSSGCWMSRVVAGVSPCQHSSKWRESVRRAVNSGARLPLPVRLGPSRQENPVRSGEARYGVRCLGEDIMPEINAPE
jgi:hypothetical protein